MSITQFRPYQVLIYGDSLFLSAIEAGLLPQAEFLVLRLTTQGPGVVEEISALKPDVVMLESGEPDELLLTLLRRGLPLLELDASQSRVWVLMRHEIALPRAPDLALLIRQVAALRAPSSYEAVPRAIQDMTDAFEDPPQGRT